MIPEDYMDRLYAGWLGKIIGVRHGANVEGWTYERINRTFGDMKTYPYDFKNFAADDDINGPMFFIRALSDYTYTDRITPEQMGLNLLNYVADGHGFFWWGGYGVSTENTAYINLKHGIMSPRSGSVEQNGAAVAEQIGGQIFIDCWGLVNPANPERAAQYAKKMSSVTHGGNGVYGGMFIASCISQAFVEMDIEKIIKTGLSVIPADCEYARMAKAVMDYYSSDPNKSDYDAWRNAFKYVKKHFGYHLYPGGCHIIPNSAVIILSLLYGRGDFSRTINIANMCGWDTDCNVGNAGTIVGVLNGLKGIGKSWRQPLNDFVCASSVIGCLNIQDIPQLVTYTAKLAYKIENLAFPDEYKDIFDADYKYFHFEYPGSTHAFRAESDDMAANDRFILENCGMAHTGKGGLKVIVPKVYAGSAVRVFNKTYYVPADFSDSRYDPDFSPVLYPGMKVESYVMIPKGEESGEYRARMYIKDRNKGKRYYGEEINLPYDKWTYLEYDIPHMDDVIICEAGVEFYPVSGTGDTQIFYLDDVKFTGYPDYGIDFAHEQTEIWHGSHAMPAQFTYRRGLWKLEDGYLSGSYAGESAEIYTGGLDWKDYEYRATLIPKIGQKHNINFRVQGAIKSYAAGLSDKDTVALYKNDNGYKILAKADFKWEMGNKYDFRITAKGNEFEVFVNGRLLIEYKDEDNPYLNGLIGMSNMDGSHTHYQCFSVKNAG